MKLLNLKFWVVISGLLACFQGISQDENNLCNNEFSYQREFREETGGAGILTNVLLKDTETGAVNATFNLEEHNPYNFPSLPLEKKEYGYWKYDFSRISDWALLEKYFDFTNFPKNKITEVVHYADVYGMSASTVSHEHYRAAYYEMVLKGEEIDYDLPEQISSSLIVINNCGEIIKEVINIGRVRITSAIVSSKGEYLIYTFQNNKGIHREEITTGGFVIYDLMLDKIVYEYNSIEDLGKKVYAPLVKTDDIIQLFLVKKKGEKGREFYFKISEKVLYSIAVPNDYTNSNCTNVRILDNGLIYEYGTQVKRVSYQNLDELAKF